MAAKVVFMFSGQGSQYFQMGQELYQQLPTFRRWMNRLDVSARELCGASVVESLYERGHGRGVPFDRTLLTHPAIFMIEYSLAQALLEGGVEPALAIGASLGTFAAASVAGCFSPEEALRVIVSHARAMEDCCEPGAMVAVLAPLALYQEAGLARHAELAAVSYHSHFVVSANVDGAGQVEAILRARDVTFQRLPVSFGFHSRWIEPGERHFKHHAGALRAAPARFPIACCAQMKLVTTWSADALWAIARQPIRFEETLLAVDRDGPFEYLDVGPSGTLATFAKYILPQTGSPSRFHTVLSPFGRDMNRFTDIVGKLAQRN